MAKSLVEIKSMARAYTETALRTLVAIAIDKRAPAAARVSASTALLDRGYGRPEMSVSSTVTHKYVARLPHKAELVEEWQAENAATVEEPTTH